MKLMPEQIRQFEEEGYFFLPGCFSDEEVAVLRDEAEEIARLTDPAQTHPMEAKKALGKDIVRFYYGEAAAEAACAEWVRRFSQRQG